MADSKTKTISRKVKIAGMTTLIVLASAMIGFFMLLIYIK